MKRAMWWHAGINFALGALALLFLLLASCSSEGMVT